jgi:hypothetical protein
MNQHDALPYGWVRFYPHVTEPWPTFPMVGYFVETERTLSGDWSDNRCKSWLSFWLGAEGIPESML